jgi:adenosylhomocysteine nucleosidase
VRLGLVVALPEEARALARLIPGARRERIPAGDAPERQRGSSFVPPGVPPVQRLSGQLDGQPLSIAWAGAGPGCAARAADVLLDEGAEGLLAIGFAGALSPTLRPGDLLLATEVVGPEGAGWPADASWLAAFLEAPTACRGGDPSVMITTAKHPPSPDPTRLYSGKLLSATRVVVAAVEKRRLGEETGAVAVDMESAAVARRAAAAGVPMLALRGITDGAEESLPLDFALCFDSAGQFHHLRLIGLLARRPRAVGGLICLGRRSSQAGRALAAFLALKLPGISR